MDELSTPLAKIMAIENRRLLILPGWDMAADPLAEPPTWRVIYRCLPGPATWCIQRKRCFLLLLIP